MTTEKTSCKLHISESHMFEELDLCLKLLSIEVSGGGKETEEFGEIHQFNLTVEYKGETRTVFWGWADITPDDKRHCAIFDFIIDYSNASSDFFKQPDEQGEWIEFMVTAPD